MMFSVVPAIPLQKCDGEEEWTPEMVRQILPQKNIFSLEFNTTFAAKNFFHSFSFISSFLCKDCFEILKKTHIPALWSFVGLFSESICFFIHDSDSANTQNIVCFCSQCSGYRTDPDSGRIRIILLDLDPYLESADPDPKPV